MSAPGSGSTPGLGNCCDCLSGVTWQQLLIVRVPPSWFTWAQDVCAGTESCEAPPSLQPGDTAAMQSDADSIYTGFDFDSPPIPWVTDAGSCPYPGPSGGIIQTMAHLPTNGYAASTPGGPPIDPTSHGSCPYNYNYFNTFCSLTVGFHNSTFYGPMSYAGFDNTAIWRIISGYYNLVFCDGTFKYPPLWYIRSKTRLIGYNTICISNRTFRFTSTDCVTCTSGDCNLVVNSCGTQVIGSPAIIDSPNFGSYGGSFCDSKFQGNLAWLMHTCVDCACTTLL